MAQAARDNHRVHPGITNAHTTTGSTSTPTGFSGYFLFFAGLGFVAFGVGLIQPPNFVPHAEWIATKFSRLGVQGLPIIAAGATIFCLGFVARLQAKVGRSLAAGEEANTQSEFTRLAEEFGQLRGALGNVQTELLANKQRQDSMLESIKTVTEKALAPEDNSNAMFRLAASLDQLGARIEERLKSQASTYDGRMADITTAVVRAQQEITEAVDLVEKSVQQQAQAFTSAPTTNYEAPYEDPSPHAQPEFTEDDFGYQEETPAESNEEELHIMVELEEEQPEPTQESPLGLLDSLDDFGGLVEPEAPLPNPPQQATENSWPPRPE